MKGSYKFNYVTLLCHFQRNNNSMKGSESHNYVCTSQEKLNDLVYW